MKNDIADILFKYTTGEATLEETNDALKEAEAGFNLEPGRNEITPDEMALTTVGDTPEEANGFGLLDTGTGSMEKVHVTNGKLDEAINQVNHDGTTNMLAFVTYCAQFSHSSTRNKYDYTPCRPKSQRFCPLFLFFISTYTDTSFFHCPYMKYRFTKRDRTPCVSGCGLFLF